MTSTSRRLQRWLPICVTLACAPAPAAETRALALTFPDRTVLDIAVYPAHGKELLIWLPSAGGPAEAEQKTAARLAAAGTETWLPDVLSARFLPPTPSSFGDVPDRDVAALIDRAAKTNKRVIVAGAGRAAAAILAGVSRWQRSEPRADALAGIVLLSPNLYVKTPEAGADAAYLPIVAHTRAPIYILQPMLSPWRWWVERLRTTLESGGSRVKVQLLPGVRDRFYFRPDATPAEEAAAADLHVRLLSAIDALRERAGTP